MTTYLVLTLIWTLYMAVENFLFVRPQSRPHFVGFLITHILLAPVSFALSLSGGILRERITDAYRTAFASKEDFANSDRKKLIG
jgi:hypothetical protein